MVEIKIFVPTYFDKFSCIADKCPDTCCIGWEVDIDDETAEKYSTAGGPLGDKIRERLTTDENNCKIFTLSEGDRCPFLNEDKLCLIHAEKGEEYLSKTCSLFPRFFDDFGDFREMGLGLGCPEGARIIMADEEPFALKLYGECDDMSDDIDTALLKGLILLRDEITAILEEKETSFRSKIEEIFHVSKEFQKKLDGDGFWDEKRNASFADCTALLERMEYIKPERKAFAEKLKSEDLKRDALTVYRSDFEKLMKYYVFRYLLKAVYDRDVLTKVKYGVFASIVISRIYSLFENPDFETRLRIMYGFSKEIEYSDVNMELLDEAMYYDFGTCDLTKLI